MLRFMSHWSRATSSGAPNPTHRHVRWHPVIELLESRTLLSFYTLEVLEPLVNRPGEEINAAQGINDSGQAVGYSRFIAAQWNPNSSVAIDLGTLAADRGSVANQVNGSGRSVGKSSHGVDPNEVTHAVMWENGPPPIELVPPGGIEKQQAIDINDAGRIAGSYSLVQGGPRGYRTDDPYTTWVQLDPLAGHTASRARGNNNNSLGGGDTVGVSIFSMSDQTAVIWRGLATTPTALQSSGGGVEKPMIANALNDMNPPMIVGKGQTVGSVHRQGALWQNLNAAPIGLGSLTGYQDSEALGINNVGQIVGIASTGPTPFNRAFIFENGVMASLTDQLCPGELGPADWLDSAYDINESGQIVGGAYVMVANVLVNKAYRLTPVSSCGPAPESSPAQAFSTARFVSTTPALANWYASSTATPLETDLPSCAPVSDDSQSAFDNPLPRFAVGHQTEAQATVSEIGFSTLFRSSLSDPN